MISPEVRKIYELLVSFLGESKSDLDESYQLQFGCPNCIAMNGEKERHKYNLEVNLQKNVFRCWSCSQIDPEMSGKLPKLIKRYGGEEALKQYIAIIETFRATDAFKLHFNNEDFNVATEGEKESNVLPPTFRLFREDKPCPKQALAYLESRGIGWDIINQYHLGFTLFDANHPNLSHRIIIPSFGENGEINFWVGRDYTSKSFQKYMNPKAEKTEIIFNESNIQWDADITLVEGSFDMLVVPNSICMLGKSLKKETRLYNLLMKKANACINVFVDGDAYLDGVKIYKLLNQGRLYGKIKIIKVKKDLDASEIYQKWGSKGIVEVLKTAHKLPIEEELKWS